MHTNRIFFCTIFFLISFIILQSFSCTYSDTTSAPSKEDSKILADMQISLKTELLNIWYPRIVDNTHGGYHTTYNTQWELISSFPKVIVTQSRGLWTASKASIRFPEDSTYRMAADHGFKFLKEYAWDKENGGFHEQIPHPDDPTPTQRRSSYKTAYGNAFAIYALTAYYELTANQEALTLAQKGFKWLDDHYYDSVYGGYFQFSKIDQKKAKSSGGPFGYQNLDSYKDYNSSIHIMEAFTALYEQWPDSHLKERLKEMLIIVKDKMIGDNSYLSLYFTEDWQHISYKDSSEQFIKRNSWNDHISFGHDTETAFLLLEAASHFDKSIYNQTLTIAKKVMDFSLKNGFDKDLSGVFYEGYQFKGDTSITIINRNKQWWVQGEAMNAYLMFSLLYPENLKYKKAFYSLWHFIDQYFIDHEYGGWYSQAQNSKGLKLRRDFKAQPWKSNYHTYRAMSQCIDMLEKQSIPFLQHETK